MEFNDVLRIRRSVRRYSGKTIPADSLERIIQAGLSAPTSRNQKPCRFIVVRNKEILKKLSMAKHAGGAMLENADAAVIPAADSLAADTWAEDSSIALSFMHLAAVNEGVGSCWVQIHLRKDEKEGEAEENVRKILSLGPEFRITGILSLGMPEGMPQPHQPDENAREKVIVIE